MNVSEIRQRIFDQMDYFPDLQQYRDSVVRRINERYQEICDSAHWLFLQKEFSLQLRKDIVATTATYDAATNDVKVTVDGTNKRKITTQSGSDLAFTSEMQGMLFIVGAVQWLLLVVRIRNLIVACLAVSRVRIRLADLSSWSGMSGKYIFTNNIY